MKKRTKIAQRMWNIHMIDTEIERGFSVLKFYTKYGDPWVNCLVGPEPLWYIRKGGED